jgi:hypothetical protein
LERCAKRAPRAVLVCIAASFLAFGAQDLKISYRTENKALLTSRGIHVEYHSARRMLIKRDNGKDILVDYVDFATYEIDHRKKAIGKTTLDDKLKAMNLMAARLGDGSGGGGGMVGWALNGLLGELGDDDNATVRSAGAERVAGRNCEKWEIALGRFSYRASADPSLVLPAPPDALERSRKLRGGALLANPKLARAFGKLFDAANGIKGVQLKTEAVVPLGPITMRNYREATEVELGPIPESVFDLPKGYRVEDAGKKMLADLEKELGRKK